MIDIETCEYTMCTANYFRPLRTYPWDDDPRMMKSTLLFDKCWFVWSDESDGWIDADDLPEEKWQALQRRMEREQKLCEAKLWEAACAAHPMYEVDTHDDGYGWISLYGKATAKNRRGRPDRMVQGQPSGAGERGREQNQATRARDWRQQAQDRKWEPLE